MTRSSSPERRSRNSSRPCDEPAERPDSRLFERGRAKPFGTRSRGQDHAQAVSLVKQVIPHGDELANDLDRLLDLKDNAHYGVLGVADAEARRAVEWARRMLKNTGMVLASV